MIAPADRVAVLRAFERSLALESHVIQRHPDLVWPQLYNRLQWEPDAVRSTLAPPLEARTRHGAEPWIHCRTRPRESRTLVRTFGGHTGSIDACALARDDATLVTAGDDGRVRIWDVSTGILRAACRGHEGPVHDLAVSDAAGLIATAGADATVRLWTLEHGQPVATLKGHDGPVHACAFGPRGDFVVSAGEDGTARTWDTKTNARGHRFSTDDPLYACGVSPDGTLIAAAGKATRTHLWNVTDGRALPALHGTYEARTCRFTADGGSLLIAGSQNDVTTLNLATGEHTSGYYASTTHHHRFYWGAGRRGPEGMALSPDGRRLLTAAPDNTVRVWEFPRGANVGTLVGHADVVRCVAFGANGTFAVSGSRDGTARLWNLRMEGTASVEHGDPVSDCAFDRDGDVLVAMWGDRTTAVLDQDSLRELRRIGTGDAHACAVSPDGRLVATAFMGILINVYDVATNRIIVTFEEKGADPSSAWIHACVFDHSGCFLISANQDGTLSVWNLQTTEKVIALEGHRGAVTDCALDPSANVLVSSSRDRSVIVWNLDTLRRTQALTAESALVCCAVCPGGTIVGGAEDGSVSAWSGADGRRRWTRRGHEGAVTACAVSPDGALVFTVGSDKMLAAWDAATGGLRARVALQGGLSCVAAHPARPSLVCGDNGGGLYHLELEGIRYRPPAQAAAASAARTAPAAAPAAHHIPARVKARVSAPADLLTALQLLLVAVPAAQAPNPLNQILLAVIVVGWVLMTRIGAKERPAVVRCDGELALLTILAAGAAVLHGLPLARQLALAAGIGIVSGVVDVAAGQHRENVALKLPLGWSLLGSVPVGWMAGIRASAAAGDDRAAAMAVGWLSGLVVGATLLIALFLVVANAREWIRGALMSPSNRGRIVLGVLFAVLAVWTGPTLLAAPAIAWMIVWRSRPSVRWNPGSSWLAVITLLAAGFALIAWPVG